MLLVRSLVAVLARTYRGKLVYWGTALHDRWLLPHVVADMRDVTDELGQAADICERMVRALRRVPVSRVLARSNDGVTIEFRQAIEPWHVLGELPVPAPRAMSILRSSDCRSR
jgi:uncharacterized protein (DUF2126 family)